LMRHRAGIVLIEEGKVALIKRTVNGKVYFVFPGGGIEADETPEQAAKREAFEELGLRVEIASLLTTVERNGFQYFYVANRVGGRFGSGNGAEFTSGDCRRGSYEPVWVGLDELNGLDVRPQEVAALLNKS